MPRSTKQKTTFTPKSVPRSVSPPAPRSVLAPALTPAPVQIQSQSMYSTIKQGFGLGLGSAIAHRLFDPSPHRNESNPRNDVIPKNEVIPNNDVIPNNESKLTTEKMYELYNKCLEKNDNKIDCNIILQQNTC
jgi:hypothetical protein